MIKHFFSAITGNILSLFGTVLVVVSLLLILVLLVMQGMGFEGGAYLGILTFVIFPMLFLLGLALIPIGLWWRKRKDAKLAAQGKPIYDEGIVGNAVPACSGCHNDDGSGTEKYPRLAGQHPAYVADQMQRFRSGERANDSKSVMRAVAKRMSDSEIKAVAEYVATLTGGAE